MMLDICRSNGLQIKQDDPELMNKFAESALELSLNDELVKYDAVIIDEAQDILTQGFYDGLDFLIKDNVSGKAIPIRNTARWAAFTKAFRRAANSAGYTTSGGAGSSYMGDYTAHFDIAAGVNPGVRQATWGGSGRPGWVSLLVN